MVAAAAAVWFAQFHYIYSIYYLLLPFSIKAKIRNFPSNGGRERMRSLNCLLMPPLIQSQFFPFFSKMLLTKI